MNATIIDLTPNAIRHIKKSIKDQAAIGFRLSVKKTGCSGYAYLPDIITTIHPTDIRQDVAEIPVFIDEPSVKFLQGTVIDYIDHGLGQTKLVFHNPNAGNLCGCGESFTLQDE